MHNFGWAWQQMALWYRVRQSHWPSGDHWYFHVGTQDEVWVHRNGRPDTPIRTIAGSMLRSTGWELWKLEKSKLKPFASDAEYARGTSDAGRDMLERKVQRLEGELITSRSALAERHLFCRDYHDHSSCQGELVRASSNVALYTCSICSSLVTGSEVMAARNKASNEDAGPCDTPASLEQSAKDAARCSEDTGPCESEPCKKSEYAPWYILGVTVYCRKCGHAQHVPMKATDEPEVVMGRRVQLILDILPYCDECDYRRSTDADQDKEAS